MKLGVLGGTFNPPHMGHLIIAEYVREAMGLGQILFVPSAIPPHKQHIDIVEAHHRLEMLSCAIQGNRYFELSDIEVQRGGVSFTIDTLTELIRLRPDDELYLLIGMDNLEEFHTWKTPEEIAKAATLVVMTRPGYSSAKIPTRSEIRVEYCEVPAIGISSSDVRQRVRQGKSVRYLIPSAVEHYILQHGLYQRPLEK